MPRSSRAIRPPCKRRRPSRVRPGARKARQDFLNIPRADTRFRGELFEGQRLTLLKPGAPLVCPAKCLQQYGIGAGPSVLEDNGTIAMGKSGRHDDGSAFSFIISRSVVGEGLHDLDTIRMHHNTLDPLTQQLRGGA